jgi:hypothetical protein
MKVKYKLPINFQTTICFFSILSCALFYFSFFYSFSSSRRTLNVFNPIPTPCPTLPEYISAQSRSTLIPTKSFPCPVLPEYTGLPPLFFVLSVRISNVQGRLDAFLWTLKSYASMRVPWSAVYLFLDVSEYSDRQEEVERAVKFTFQEECSQINLLWRHVYNKTEWLFYINEMVGNRSYIGHPDSLVWFMQNDDHAFVDFATDVLSDGLHLLASDRSKYKSLYLSHWPEIIRLSVKGNLSERIGRSFVRFPLINTDAIQIFNARFLYHLYADIPWEPQAGKGSRIDGLGLYSLSPSLTTYVPLREICRHFGGYGHVSASSELWPQLNVSRKPDSYTQNVSRSTLVSRMLTRHSSAWTHKNHNTIPLDWIRTMLSLYGHNVKCNERIDFGVDDWP